MNPRVLITGGNRGVGKGIFEHFSPDAHSVSRSNGFDIGSMENRQSIVQLSLECDIFINHAHNGHLIGQTQLLYEVFDAWTTAGKKGYIFNTGSFATYLPSAQFKRYSIIKKSLEIANQQCCKKIENGLCNFRMTLLKPGMLATDSPVSDSNWEGHRLGSEEIAPLINYLYKTPESLLINEVVLTGIAPRK